MPGTRLSIDAALADDEDRARALLHRIAQRDRCAMDQFYSLFQESVYRFALSASGDPGAASDVLNDTMLRLWAHADPFRGPSRALCHVLALAFQASAGHSCERGRQEADALRPDDAAPDLNDSLPRSEFRGRSGVGRLKATAFRGRSRQAPVVVSARSVGSAFGLNRPESRIEPVQTFPNSGLRPCVEDIRQVQDAVARLDALFRQTLHLAFFEDLSPTEIAEVMGCTKGTVRRRIFRARRLLKRPLRTSLSAGLRLIDHADLVAHANGTNAEPERARIDQCLHDCEDLREEYRTFLKLRRALQQPLTPAPGDFGLDRLQQAIDALEAGERRRHWTLWLKNGLLRWFGPEPARCSGAYSG
ncbi:MAG: sigma-70 family RNA polymerase sigma factor [Panacagrimonas sp.]